MSYLIKLLKIDDPLDAVPVHGGCGLWGLIAAGLFSTPWGVKAAYGSAATSAGLWWGDGEQFGMQWLAAVVVIGWSAVWTIPFFILMRIIPGGLRITEEAERKGIDEELHAAVAYAHVSSEDLDECIESVKKVQEEKKKQKETKTGETSTTTEQHHNGRNPPETNSTVSVELKEKPVGV